MYMNTTVVYDTLPYKIISDELMAMVTVVIKSALYVSVGAFGVVTNIICLKVFWTMGFKDTINVSFFAIALADLGCLLCLLWMGICYNPLFAYADVNFDSRSVQYLTGGWPKFYFTRVSGLITAYVTFERCLCTTMPLKVKVVLTPRRVSFIHVIIYVINALVIVPTYVSTRLSWRWYPSRNASILTLDPIVDKGIFNITNDLNAFLQNGSFIFVVICTIILVNSLNESRRWKLKSSTRKTDFGQQSKENRASRRVVKVSALYIACNLPGSLASLGMIVFPEVNAGESQQNLFFFLAAFNHTVEAVNASVNIFIYLETSMKFLKIFFQTFSSSYKNRIYMNTTVVYDTLPYTIISDELLAIVSVVMKSALYDGIGAFRVVTNIICLKVFWTMGFKDTINVSFFAIALADLGCLLCLLWMGICYNPLLAYADVNFESRKVQYLTGGWPKFYFTRVSGLITAYVTFERCLCTTMPLKVKVVLTPKRVCIIHVIIYVINALVIVPIYVSTRMSWRWSPSRNASILSLDPIVDKEIFNITNDLNAFLQNGSFIFVVICTIILVNSLNESRRWKLKSTRKMDFGQQSKENSASRRVVIVSALYIACNLPGSLASLGMIVFPEVNAGESQQNLFFFLAAFNHTVEAVNASVNIFIYLETSMKFLKIFFQTFTCSNSSKNSHPKLANLEAR
ncbi:hypothetical protein Btru_070160 [Bulinus truncatus]|nr:hypothetical protein Btru_070160 [Bulinus truncatus]